MGTYFGTDGIRGVFGEELSPDLAMKCGNSLSRLCIRKKVIIGRDTRITGDLLALSFSSGLISGGINVIDVGVATTPCIAFLTKKLNCDFGVVISASHNPSEFNGIKIFNSNGYKIDEDLESQIERKFFQPVYKNYENIGHYYYSPKLLKLYYKSISNIITPLNKIKIVVDCANGASYKIARILFKKLNTKIYFINNKNDGLNINNNCGALFPQTLSKVVLEKKADIGFAFDGDADRIICCDEKGNIIDGDDILYILRQFSNNKIVGTSISNKGLENTLKQQNIEFYRADVGDKYVIETMNKNQILLGGEPSGHIIVYPFSTTGDGILTALLICQVLNEKHKKLSELVDYKKFPQININISVKDKFRVLNSDLLSSQILKIQQMFGENGRILVRASGTEPKLRIMCEHINLKIAQKYSTILKKIVLSLNKK